MYPAKEHLSSARNQIKWFFFFIYNIARKCKSLPCHSLAKPKYEGAIEDATGNNHSGTITAYTVDFNLYSSWAWMLSTPHKTFLLMYTVPLQETPLGYRLGCFQRPECGFTDTRNVGRFYLGYIENRVIFSGTFPFHPSPWPVVFACERVWHGYVS